MNGCDETTAKKAKVMTDESERTAVMGLEFGIVENERECSGNSNKLP
ncbi:hypothetical protein L195_g033398 [Trifolium pratense]|uniref:Uncharacterized protein n=1 Tax=Trifolium pratense TaxID=57577 RepID=A0A2K3LFW9_TRIPR|nr:hypothetical protein L195_g033398 [Trifolium pratense]